MTATLGGVALPADPERVNVSFQMKCSDTETVGGKVVQVYGVTLSDLTISGSHPGRVRDGRVTESWEEQLRFRRRINRLMEEQERKARPDPIRFAWPLKGYDLDVFVKQYTSPDGADSTDDTVARVVHRWQLTLFIVGDRTRRVVKGLKDLYLRRLAEGVGWHQTDYNGPTVADVDQLLQGRTVWEFLQSEANAAARGDIPTTGDQMGFLNDLGTQQATH